MPGRGLITDAQRDFRNTHVGILLEHAECCHQAYAPQEFERRLSNISLKQPGKVIGRRPRLAGDPRQTHALGKVEADIPLSAADLRSMKLALMCLFDHATVYKVVQVAAFPELRNHGIFRSRQG